MKTLSGIIFASVVLGALPVGCSHQGTLTQGRLHMSTRLAVLDADRTAAPDCDKRSVVHTEVVERPDVIVTPLANTPVPQPPAHNFSTAIATNPGERGFSRGVERWTVDRCGTEVSYLVQFEPTDTGNTRISVKPE